MLQVQNLTVKLKNSEKVILNKLSFNLNKGEIMSISGKNGSGKSTLVQVIMGNPNFEIVSGKIIFDNIEINNLTPDERSKLGIFLAFQSPIEIPGINMFEYLKLIYNIHHEKKLSVYHFRKIVKELVEQVGLSEQFLERSLNEGFSGGERKKCEILQMLLIEPKLVILDEIDSGLDKLGIEMVISEIRKLSKTTSIILISHYEKLVSEVNVDKIVNL